MKSVKERKIESGYAKRKSHFWGEIALYFCAFIMLIPAKTGNINGFCDGFYISAVSTYAPTLAVYPLYIVTQLLLCGERVALIRSLILSSVVTACALITSRYNSNLKFVGCAVSGAVSLVACALVLGGETVYLLISGALSLSLAYAGKIALCGIYEKPKGFRPNAVELGCCAIVLVALSNGVASVNLFNYSPVYAFGMVVGATVCLLLGKGEGIIAGICVGIGQALYTYEITSIAHFALVFTVYSLFCSAVRPLSTLSAFMASVVFWLYFRVNYIQAFPSLVSLGVGCVIFCIIPMKFFSRLSSVLLFPSSKACLRRLINSSREDDYKKVENLASIFSQMARGLGALEQVSSDSETAVPRLIEDTVCSKCNRCEKEKRWGALCAVSAQIERFGRVIVKDNPYFLQVNCPHCAKIFTLGEKENERLCRQKSQLDELKKRKQESAKEMSVVASILLNFNKTLSYPVSCDDKLESALVEELRYHGIVSCDALIEKENLDKVTVMVSSDTADCDKIVEVANKVLGSAFSLVSLDSVSENYSVVRLVEKTPYDAIFAVSGQSKTTIATGDTHTFTKISPTKFIVAICDGMGHGQSANIVSDTAISLVESFYKAGFDSDYIIEQVNRFIYAQSEEKFVAFDIFVCDLLSLQCTLIKMGSPSSFIITSSEVSLIEGSALPLGAMGRVSPCVYNDVASEGQTVLLVSDGVSDCYENNSLHAFVANYSGLSPKGLTDAVLADAKKRCGGKIADDMTVVAVKIIRRI